MYGGCCAAAKRAERAAPRHTRHAVQVLMDNSGAALGIFVSCLFNDLSVALSVMPMFLLPLSECRGK